MTEVGDLPLDVTSHTRHAHAMTTGTDLDSVALNLRPCNHSYRSSSHQDPYRSHSWSFHRSSCTATSHMTEAPVPTTTIMIHPTTGPHLTGTLPRLTADPNIGPGNTSHKPDWRIFIHIMGTILETQGQKTQTSHN